MTDSLRTRSPVEQPERSGLDPGSFRDPDSRVFYADDGAVLRALSERGLADWRALADSGLLARAVEQGWIVATEEADAVDAPAVLTERCAGVLRHERVPFVSYPYEWTFGMLRDAALRQLDLLLAALGEDLVLKDATPYNVQFRGAQPVFVDVGSFERLRPGEPWAGYRQFCTLFLYPLMLQAYKGVAFQPWLRGSLEGIPPQEMRGLLSFRDRFRRGVFTHVLLHSRLERRHGDRGGEVRGELRAAGFRKELIEANARKLRRLVQGLDWRPPAGVWTEYGEKNTYTDADTERKTAFVREVAAGGGWRLAWDMGCNDGRFSRIAAEGADCVVAFDADPGPVELLYRSLRDEGESRILPLTLNLADPSPPLGWRNLERRALPDRGRPDLVLALALVHHVAITANVPVRDFVAWLAELGAALVIEFPTRDDPMVEKLLAAKRDDLHPDYEQDFFERCLAEAFEVVRSERLPSGTRQLYFARPKGGPSGR